MIKPKVSVIVPVYNSEKTIAKCLDSILSQDYTDFECIVVNDGSTDDTDAICQSFNDRFEKIKYIKTANCGVSHARNVGIDVAKGDFLIFVDSDDYLLDSSIRFRIEKMKDDSLVICGYCEDNNDNMFVLDEKNTVDNLDEFLLDLFYMRRFGYQGYIWNKMFSSNIVRENNLRFDESIYYNEDRLFVYQYLLKCNCVCYVHKCLYCYTQNDSSAMYSVRQNSYNHKQITELNSYLSMISNASTNLLKNSL